YILNSAFGRYELTPWEVDSSLDPHLVIKFTAWRSPPSTPTSSISTSISIPRNAKIGQQTSPRPTRLLKLWNSEPSNDGYSRNLVTKGPRHGVHGRRQLP